MLERTAFARSAKHIINSKLRDCPDHLISTLLSNVINDIFQLKQI